MTGKLKTAGANFRSGRFSSYFVCAGCRKKKTGTSEIIFKNSGLVEAGRRKSNFVQGLKLIESFLQTST